MNNVNKELPKALTIEDLKQRIGKPVFVVGLTYGNKEWRVLKASGFAVANTLEFTDSSKITEEHQGNFKFFDEEVTALELKEILDAEKKTKKTGYERAGKGETYSTINSLKEVTTFINDEFLEIYKEKRFEAANYFNDEKLCENIARAEILKYQLRRFAALNGGIPSQADWKNSHVAKYEIIGESDNFIHATKNFESRDVGVIYFKDIEACKKAIEIFKDELLWYFTEFEEMLY